MRTIVDISEEQRRKLDQYCAEERVSRAEAVRRAVGILLAEKAHTRQSRAEAIRAGAGVWKHDMRDARVIVDEMRQEWDERERRLGL